MKRATIDEIKVELRNYIDNHKGRDWSDYKGTADYEFAQGKIEGYEKALNMLNGKWEYFWSQEKWIGSGGGIRRR